MNFSWPKKLLFLSLVFFIAKNTHGQTNISGIINDYAKVTAVNTSCNSVSVISTSGFNVGAKVLLIQMKGTTVNGSNAAAFGNITTIGNAGNYEFNVIQDIQGAVIYLKYTFSNTYNPVGLQLVTIPQYSDATIIDTLTAKAWDGNTGGVLVFEATGTVTFNADINVEGLGFRGGAVSPANTLNNCAYGSTTYYTAANTNGYGGKGESVSEYIAGRESAQANQANGGGGGHSSNSGAGGGANYGAGGRGGRQSAGCSILANPFGIGGIALSTYYPSKIFVGGGGGGGQQNNYAAPGPPNWIGATPGNPGGGIVILKAQTIIGNGHSINAAGFNNRSRIGPSLVGYSNGVKRSWGDSGGGGGGGGSVLVSATNFSSPISIDAKGGRGDTVFTEIATNLGPGGGGGGGAIFLNGATVDPNVTTNVTGGVSGISWHFTSTTPTVCFCPYSATNGSNGAIINNLVITESNIVFAPSCVTTPVTLLNFSGKEINGKIQLNWTTIAEINNDYFVLEKSSDGFQYEYFATIEGNGNSDRLISYTQIDRSPFPGANYYRLKQFDFDGLEHIDGHAMAQFSGMGDVIEKIYPNPFTNELIIQTSGLLSKSQTEIKIFNLLGSEIDGIHPILEENTINLNTSALAKGIYFLQITTEGRKEIRKIIKE